MSVNTDFVLDEQMMKDLVKIDDDSLSGPKRPCNAFILFRRALAAHPLNKHLNGTILSKESANLWNNADKKTRLFFQNLSKAHRDEHKKKYPNFDYMSSRAKKGLKAHKKAKSLSPTSSTCSLDETLDYFSSPRLPSSDIESSPYLKESDFSPVLSDADASVNFNQISFSESFGSSPSLFNLVHIGSSSPKMFNTNISQHVENTNDFSPMLLNNSSKQIPSHEQVFQSFLDLENYFCSTQFFETSDEIKTDYNLNQREADLFCLLNSDLKLKFEDQENLVKQMKLDENYPFECNFDNFEPISLTSIQKYLHIF